MRIITVVCLVNNLGGTLFQTVISAIFFTWLEIKVETWFITNGIILILWTIVAILGANIIIKCVSVCIKR